MGTRFRALPPVGLRPSLSEPLRLAVLWFFPTPPQPADDSMIPLGVKIGAIVLLIALVTGGYFAWAHHQQALGAAAVNLKNAQAIIAQREIDQAENAKAVARLAQKLQDTETKVITTERVIYAAPRTTACPEQPAIRAAIDGVRDIYADPIQAPDRRRTAPAVPASGPPAKLSK
jgi:hypothetical protein